MSISSVSRPSAPLDPGVLAGFSRSADLLSRKPAAAVGSQPKPGLAFQTTGEWIGFTGRAGAALQAKLGKGPDGRAAVQMVNGKTYALPASISGHAAIARWLTKADSAGAISGAWPNLGAASKIEPFKLNRGEIVARERLSGTWEVKASGIKASTTYSRASLEFDKKHRTLKLYVQPPAGELQLFEIDVGATVYNQRGALTSNGIAGVTHDLFRLQKEHPVLATVVWTVMGAIGAAASRNPEIARHIAIGAASSAVGGQADEVRVSLAQAKVSSVAQSRLNVVEIEPGGGVKPLNGELRAGLTAEGSIGRVSAAFNKSSLGPSADIPFGPRAKALVFTGGALVGKVELHAKATTEQGRVKLKPDVKAQEFISLGGKKETGWRVVIGADGRALDLATETGRVDATTQFSDLPSKLRLQALDPDDKGARHSLVTGVVPRLEVNSGKAGQRKDPTIYQSRSPIDNAVSQLVFGKDSAYGGVDISQGWQRQWNEFNRAIGGPFSNRLVPLSVVAGDLKAIGSKFPERHGELAYVNEKRLLEANGERLYWVQTGRGSNGKPIRVACLREGDVYNTSLVTIEGKPGLHLAKSQLKKGSSAASALPAAAPTKEWPGPSPSDAAQKSARGYAAYHEAESYLERLRMQQSKPGLSTEMSTRIQGQIETLMQRLAQGRTSLVDSSHGLIKREGDRLIPSARLIDAIHARPRDVTRQDAYKQYLTTL